VLKRLGQAVLVVSIVIFPIASYGQQTTVLINVFENQTGDRTLDWIGEGLSATVGERLSTQPRLYVFGYDERNAEYDRLGIPETASFSRATAIRMAWDMGADFLVMGRISGTHDAFQVEARILNLTDDTQGSDIRISGRLDDVISMAASLASQLCLQLIPGSALPESDYAARPPIPRSAFEAYTRGIMSTDTQRRVELLQNAIRLHPQYRAAIYQLGQVYYLDSNYKSSSELLEKIPVDTPEYPQARFMVGMNAYHLGDHAKAAEIFSTLSPTYDVLVNLGASLAATGDPDAAVSAWRRALVQNPSGSEAAFNLGYLSFTRSEWDLAANRFAQFLQEHPRDSETMFLLGQTYDRLGRADESGRLMAQALRASPRLERWVSQPIPNLVRVRTQFNATELRMPQGIWSEPRRTRRGVAQTSSEGLTGVRP